MELSGLEWASALELLIIGLMIALILVSIVGNCLVCVAIFTDRRLRKLGNAFIVSLAIADLFVSCLVMTFALCNDLMQHWIFGDWFCDVWISFDIMCCTASILNLCAISLDRFVHIKDCLLYNQWMTRRVAISAVIIIWFISATVSFVPINLGWHRPDHFLPASPLELAAVGGPKLNYAPRTAIENQSSLDWANNATVPLERHAFPAGSSGQAEEEKQQQQQQVQFNRVESNRRDAPIKPPPEASIRSPAPGQLGQCMLTLTPTYAIVSSTISFYIPCIIMLGLYTKLFACARKHVRNIQAISKAPPPITVTSRTLQVSAPALVSNSGANCGRSEAPPLRTWLRFGRRRKQPNSDSSGGQSAPLDREDPNEGRPQEQLEAGQKPVSSQEAEADFQANNCPEQSPFLLAKTVRPAKPVQEARQQHHVHYQTQTQQQRQQQAQSGQLATHKAAVTLGIIMGTFLFCWVPFFCLNIIKAFCGDCVPGSIFRAFTWLGYANSALNPIIYGIHNSEFRNAFNRIFFKHLNFKNSRYYLNRRLSQDLRLASSQYRRGKNSPSLGKQQQSSQSLARIDTNIA